MTEPTPKHLQRTLEHMSNAMQLALAELAIAQEQLEQLINDGGAETASGKNTCGKDAEQGAKM